MIMKMIIIVITIIIIAILLQVDLWRSVAEVALCLWLHQPSWTSGRAHHHHDDNNDDDGDYNIDEDNDDNDDGDHLPNEMAKIKKTKQWQWQQRPTTMLREK